MTPRLFTRPFAPLLVPSGCHGVSETYVTIKEINEALQAAKRRKEIALTDEDKTYILRLTNSYISWIRNDHLTLESSRRTKSLSSARYIKSPRRLDPAKEKTIWKKALNDLSNRLLRFAIELRNTELPRDDPYIQAFFELQHSIYGALKAIKIFDEFHESPNVVVENGDLKTSLKKSLCIWVAGIAAVWAQRNEHASGEVNTPFNRFMNELHNRLPKDVRADAGFSNRLNYALRKTRRGT